VSSTLVRRSIETRSADSQSTVKQRRNTLNAPRSTPCASRNRTRRWSSQGVRPQPSNPTVVHCAWTVPSGLDDGDFAGRSIQSPRP